MARRVCVVDDDQHTQDSLRALVQVPDLQRRTATLFMVARRELPPLPLQNSSPPWAELYSPKPFDINLLL